MKKTNYGDLTEEFSNYKNSKVVVLPVPYDGTSTWQKGADKGPDAILHASANMEVYDIETDSEVHKIGIHTAEPITESSSPEALSNAVYKKVKELFNKGKFPVLLGGEHSVSIGAFKAAVEAYDELTILQLDAHADMRQSYMGSEHNHACVMARAKELAPILQVGIRSMSVEERDDVQPDRIFYSSYIHENSNWMYDILNKVTRNVYITIDLDVFDPSIMPSTGTPEPGGLGWFNILDILRRISEQSNIVGFDVVELKPNPDNKAPDLLAAKLIYTLLTYKFINGLK